MNIEQFWQAYLTTLPTDIPKPTQYEAWGFGDSPQMADALGALVVQGIKTATCSLLWEYEFDGDPLPALNSYHIITNGLGEPLSIIEVVDVTIQPYNQVSAEFAYAEGEGDRSLAYWRQVHWHFFSKVCKRIGCEIDETMPLVCERFRVIYPLI